MNADELYEEYDKNGELIFLQMKIVQNLFLERQRIMIEVFCARKEMQLMVFLMVNTGNIFLCPIDQNVLAL